MVENGTMGFETKESFILLQQLLNYFLIGLSMCAMMVPFRNIMRKLSFMSHPAANHAIRFVLCPLIAKQYTYRSYQDA